MENNGFNLPEEVQRVDVIIIEKVINKDGSMAINMKFESSDEAYRNSVTALEIIGFMEFAKKTAIDNVMVKKS